MRPSAHDLRRSFGECWSSRVMPQVLKQLMRHESIETTLRYYVGSNADLTADVLWEAHKRLAINTGTQTADSVTAEVTPLSTFHLSSRNDAQTTNPR